MRYAVAAFGVRHMDLQLPADQKIVVHISVKPLTQLDADPKHQIVIDLIIGRAVV